ncbi:hypothetical protein BC939DRAFT_452353 [Gamsiella multidivaricata]|uniref:uncharacterized protein n=1 Tax=Gamsiella multidivaricata TaxID=101098 RepID=UPI00221FDEF1|nr:uncharacterized protein BC939DRAFT_452353 [Gamsiella multidivaricata]KAI7822962.1 hypothetical protein BC939DRAFT_452353 [Gamsiella multidivaricata]
MRLPLLSATLGTGILLSLAAFTEAIKVKGQVFGVKFRGRVMRGVSTKTRVLLSGGSLEAQVHEDGSFVFPDVPIGTYFLKVHSPHLTYPKARLAVTASGVRATRFSLSNHFASPQQELPYPLVLRPHPRPGHYIALEAAKVAGWFVNPMLLMSSFSLLMLLLMPRIIANLDEEALHALRSSYDSAPDTSLPAVQRPLEPVRKQQTMVSPHRILPQQYQPQMKDRILEQNPRSFFQTKNQSDFGSSSLPYQRSHVPVQSKKLE